MSALPINNNPRNKLRLQKSQVIERFLVLCHYRVRRAPNGIIMLPNPKHLTLHNQDCTFIAHLCLVYTVCCSLYTLQYTQYTIQCKLDPVHKNTLFCQLHIAHFKLSTIHTSHCTLKTAHFTLHNSHCTIHTEH